MRNSKLIALLLAFCLLFSGCAEIAQAPSSQPPSGAGSAPVFQADDGELTVHFIDVGQADCILVLGNGQAMLIDAGNNDDSPLVIEYLKSLGIETLDVVIGTHPHEDHIGGLDDVIDAFEIGKIYLSYREHTTKTYLDVLDAIQRKNMKYSVPKAGDEFLICGGQAQVVGPVQEYEDINNASIVLRLVYGEVSFLFTGDMEAQAENDVLDRGYPVASDVLKVGHHGSSTSSSYVFLREVSPQYAVIMCETDNSYGHPHEEVMERLRDMRVQVWRTDLEGTIVLSTDGKTLTASAGEAARPQTSPNSASSSEQSQEQVYIGNKNSKVFHQTTCNSLPAEKNQIEFESREAATAQGFTPCGGCKP